MHRGKPLWRQLSYASRIIHTAKGLRNSMFSPNKNSLCASAIPHTLAAMRTTGSHLLYLGQNLIPLAYGFV